MLLGAVGVMHLPVESTLLLWFHLSEMDDAAGLYAHY